jgi:transcription initiation factor TFIIIB Brf1 subunit/transcription initiation factor TFIIB
MFGNCKNCEQNNWVTDDSRGDVICFDCGLTLDLGLIGSEKSVYSDTHNSISGSSGGSNISPYSSLSHTYIVSKDKSSHIVKNHHHLAGGFELLQDKHLQDYFTEIKNFGALLSLSSAIQQQARDFILEFEKAQGATRRTYSCKVVALAAIFIACKEARNGKTLEQLLLIAHSDNCTNRGRDEGPNNKVVVTENNLMEVHDRILEVIPRLRMLGTTSLKMTDVIQEQCRILALSKEVSEASCNLYEKCEDFIDGLSQGAISGGCIYLACSLMKVRVSKEDVAVAAVITPSTIDNFCRIVNLTHPVSIIDLKKKGA